MQRKRFNGKLNIWIVAFLLALTVGCSNGGDGAAPVLPDIEDAPPANVPDRLVGQYDIGPEGGTVDLDWFVLDFPEGALAEQAMVTIYESHLQRPHEGIIVGGTAMRLKIEPASGFPEVHHDEAPLLADSAFYSCTFHLDRLPAAEGAFGDENEYVDIVAEWREDEHIITGNAWAHRDAEFISVPLTREKIILAVVDYSQIPELTAEPIFTDDPRELTGHYARYGQGIDFDPANLGPLGDRIPVLLIHGLQLLAQDEPDSISDKEAAHGEHSFELLLQILNSGFGNLFSDFKFFWYCYPTGVHIFGGGGATGDMLGELLEDWAYDNDPELLERPLVIVAHSMGGLVAREFMQNHDGNVFRIITVATPHLGSPIVNIGDDLGLSWINDFLTPGVLDLACCEEISYWKTPSVEQTCSLLNPELEALNSTFSEDDPRLICYGATDVNMPDPPKSDPLHWIAQKILCLVSAPGGFVEGDGGYYSDCVVPWRSQYYKTTGDLDSEDLWRTSTTKYHMGVLGDLSILYHLYLDLLKIKDEYEIPVGVSFQWARTWGGTIAATDVGYGVVADDLGNVYVTGLFYGTVDFDPGPGIDEHSSNGSWDLFLSKFDSSGNFQWARTWDSKGQGVAVDGSGNVYVTGAFGGTVDFDPGPGIDEHTGKGQLDVFLSKFDSSGDFLWARTWGGEHGEYGNGVAVGWLGNAYVTGNFYGTADFDPGGGDPHTSNDGSSDVFLSKFDSSGDFLWASTWGGPETDYGWDIATDGSGNVYVSGSFRSTVDFDPGSGIEERASNGESDIFLSKFDFSGFLLWTRTSGAVGEDGGRGVVTEPPQNVYVAGYFKNTVDFDPGPGVDEHSSIGGADIFLNKFDSSGNFHWARTWGGMGDDVSQDDVGRGVGVDGSGNVYVMGSFRGTVDFDPGPIIKNLDSNGGYDIFLSRFESPGDFEWAGTWGGTENDRGYGLSVDGLANAYVTGRYRETADFDPGEGIDMHTSNGTDDIFLSKFSADGG